MPHSITGPGDCREKFLPDRTLLGLSSHKRSPRKKIFSSRELQNKLGTFLALHYAPKGEQRVTWSNLLDLPRHDPAELRQKKNCYQKEAVSHFSASKYRPQRTKTHCKNLKTWCLLGPSPFGNLRKNEGKSRGKLRKLRCPIP